MTHTPTPAEIETLREAVNGCGGSSYTQAIAILDRLSPAPEPEVDEATVWTRKVLGAEYHTKVNTYENGERDDASHFTNARDMANAAKAAADEIDHLRQQGQTDAED